MKRSLSFVLAALLAAASLASCMIKPEPSQITVTSSDAATYADWLVDRLGDDLPAGVVLGTSADGYGIALDAFEDDGYVLRTVGDETLLFARTTTGLDRAVRRYAKAVECGENGALDVTYHEGYRIKKLTLAGNDISTYTITVDDPSDYRRALVERDIASSMAALISKACGAEIELNDDNSANKIIFRFMSSGELVESEDCKESSYRYCFEGDDLVIEYTEFAGARNGMCRFLENECGWTDLYYGRDELQASDLVAVDRSTDVTCHPRFGGMRFVTIGELEKGNSLAVINKNAFEYKYRVRSAHHSVGRLIVRQHGMNGGTKHMPCLTSDTVFEDAVEEIAESLDASINAGAKIGDDLVNFDLGMEDSSDWCRCKSCVKLAANEGGTWAGPMVYFANRVDDALDELGYDGLTFSIFAYAGSNKPPKSAPNDDIYVTFVANNACSHHLADGSQCTGKVTPLPSLTGGMVMYSNADYAEMIRGWCALSDNVYVRPAPLRAELHPFTLIAQTYDDVCLYSDYGVNCIYNELYTFNEMDFGLVITELWEDLMFNPDMTRTEYYEDVARLFEKYYGDGWKEMLDYVDCLEETEMATGECWTIWNSYRFTSSPTQYDHALFVELWDRMLDDLDKAARVAESAEKQRRIELLRMTVICEGCYASYYYAYEEGDDERIEMLEARWAEMIELAHKNNVYDEITHTAKHYDQFVCDTLAETAWTTRWALERDQIMRAAGYISVLRPVPEEYADAEIKGVLQ